MNPSPSPKPNSVRPRNHATVRVPGATYRLQFNASFTLRDATGLLDYLHDLGITDIYASPLFQASPSSTHGYDACCHDQISECLGGQAGFDEFTTRLRELGLGLLLDIVPNHMGAEETNAWWWDVLKHGPASRYANYFDINWSPRDEWLRGKVLLPVLGARLPKVISAGDLKILRERGEWLIGYYDKRFPITPSTPSELLWRLGGAMEAEFKQDAMLAVLDAQHYRLAYWRVGPHEINYRRFFDVASLVALRMEDEGVFEATHKTLFEWVGSGKVTGLRVDHPDGLRDPRTYFGQLQKRFSALAGPESQLFVVAEKILSDRESLPTDWPIAGTTGYEFLNCLNGLFVAGENERTMTELYSEFTACVESFEQIAHRSKKRILEISFTAEVDSLAARLRELAMLSFAGRDLTLEQLRSSLIELVSAFPTYRTYVRKDSVELSTAEAHAVRRGAITAKTKAPHLADEIDFISSLLEMRAQVSADHPEVVKEFIISFQQLTGPAAAKGIEDTAFYNYNRLISLNEVGGEPAQFGTSLEEFHQQNRFRCGDWPHSLLATATHDTKRGEDARARINVLSEMPTEWRASVLRWCEMNAKYKVEFKGRLAPDANDEYLLYQTLVGAWPAALSKDGIKETAATGESCPALESFRQRISQYMLKATREAKANTSWTDPNQAYEDAMNKFLGHVLDEHSEFVTSFAKFQSRLAFFGGLNSLSQILLKLASPGVPDFFQGTELWDLSLVDPDNRRPVDYDDRRQMLENLKKRFGAESQLDFTSNDFASGAVKMFLISRALQFRRSHPELFDNGDYGAVLVNGASSNHVCAFSRSIRSTHLIVVCPRLAYTLLRGKQDLPTGLEVWGDDALDLSDVSATRFRNIFTGDIVPVTTGRTLPVARVLQTFPVALLASD